MLSIFSASNIVFVSRVNKTGSGSGSGALDNSERQGEGALLRVGRTFLGSGRRRRGGGKGEAEGEAGEDGEGGRDGRSEIRAFKTGDDDLGGLILRLCLDGGAEFLGNSVVDARFLGYLEGCFGGLFWRLFSRHDDWNNYVESSYKRQSKGYH